MNNSIVRIVNYFNLLSALILSVSLIFFQYNILKTGYLLFFGSYVVEIFVEQKWKNIKLDKRSIYFFGMLLFFLLAIIYLPFETSRKYTHLLLDKRLPILGFSIVGIFGLNKKFRLSYFFNTFIVTSVVVIFYLVFYRIGISEFIHNPLRAELLSAQRILWVNSHMIFNFYLNVSLIAIWFILKRTWQDLHWWKKVGYFVAFIIIFGILSISEGRSGFLMAILLTLSFVFIELIKRNKMIGIIVGILIPFLFVGIVSHHKRMSEKMLEGEPRIFIWESALSVIKEGPFIGFGISDAQEKFDEARTHYQTEEYRLQWASSKHLDSHDQYLQTTMEFGIVGLGLLLFLYFYPLLIVDGKRKFFAILLLGLCIYQSIFDMFITGPFSMFFGLIVCLILVVENDMIKSEETDF